MKKGSFGAYKKLIGLFLTAAIAAFAFTYIAPKNIYIVVLFISLIAFLSYFLASFFVARKYQYLIGIFVFIFLGINYLVGFEIVNTVLLLSIVIGVSFLLK